MHWVRYVPAGPYEENNINYLQLHLEIFLQIISHDYHTIIITPIANQLDPLNQVKCFMFGLTMRNEMKHEIIKFYPLQIWYVKHKHES